MNLSVHLADRLRVQFNENECIQLNMIKGTTCGQYAPIYNDISLILDQLAVASRCTRVNASRRFVLVHMCFACRCNQLEIFN